MATNSTLESNYNIIVRDRIALVKKKANEAIRLATKDMVEYLNEEIRKIFIDVVNEFYNDYDPLTYERDYTLGTLLETEVLHGSNPGLAVWLEPTNMTTFRSGYDGEDGLYDQVFRKGWHGGADMGPWHPDPLTPYWRTPHPGYYRWGRAAERMDPPPLELFQEKLREAFEGRFTDHYQELINKRTAEIYNN